MGINQFKTYALRTMCEAHLWKIGEEDIFFLKGWEYRIVLVRLGASNYAFTLQKRVKGRDWTTPLYFKDLGRLFHDLFRNLCISYE